MADVRPHGATRDVLYAFSKVFVHDLDAMARFYEEVFGLVPFNRHQDVMLGREIDEITYLATSAGGASLTLIKYVDSTGPTLGEAVQGFTTTDIEALVGRAQVLGGRVPNRSVTLRRSRSRWRSSWTQKAILTKWSKCWRRGTLEIG
jgi:predicted enzyme related to lactoylglutathione lyase